MREGKCKLVTRLVTVVGTVALAFVMAVGVVACGSAEAAIIGTKEDGCTSFKLTNGLGHAVVAMSARDGVSEDDFPASFMGEDQGLAADATAEVELPAGMDGKNVDLLLTCDDGSQVVAEDVDVTAASEFTVKTEDGVGFLAYKDADGNEKDTKQASLAAKQAREEAAAAEAQAAADAQAAQAVADQVAALPAVDALTLDDATKQAVADAHAAYDALTDAQRALLPAETAQGIVDREAQLVALQQQADAAAAEAAAKAQAEAAAKAQKNSQSTSSSSTSYKGTSGGSSSYGGGSSSKGTSGGSSSSGGSSAPSQGTEDCTKDNIPLSN